MKIKYLFKVVQLVNPPPPPHLVVRPLKNSFVSIISFSPLSVLYLHLQQYYTVTGITSILQLTQSLKKRYMYLM